MISYIYFRRQNIKFALKGGMRRFSSRTLAIGTHRNNNV